MVWIICLPESGEGLGGTIIHQIYPNPFSPRLGDTEDQFGNIYLSKQVLRGWQNHFDKNWHNVLQPPSYILGDVVNNLFKERAYILKAGVSGVQTPQTIWNFPKKDCLRTQKLSKLQYVRNKG